MNHQVWIKDEFGEKYTRVDCGDIAAAKREIDKGIRMGMDPILTQEIPYELSIKFVEVKVETKKDKAELDKGARAESNSEVRRGDETAAEGLDKGSRDHGPGPGPGA